MVRRQCAAALVAVARRGGGRWLAAPERAACRGRRAAGPTRSWSLKSERRLYLLRGGEVLESYRVALGRAAAGHQALPGRRPDARRAATAIGRVQSGQPVLPRDPGLLPERAGSWRGRGRWARRPAGDIMIHGLAPERRHYGAEHWLFDWTNGCIAVTNRGNRRDLAAGRGRHADRDPPMIPPRLMRADRPVRSERGRGRAASAGPVPILGSLTPEHADTEMTQ